jgi:hypothetical protein
MKKMPFYKSKKKNSYSKALHFFHPKTRLSYPRKETTFKGQKNHLLHKHFGWNNNFQIYMKMGLDL